MITVLRHTKNLEGTRYGISKDLPDALRKARKNLEADRREARQEGIKATVAYPAKLIVDGVVVRDEILDWTRVLRA